MNNNNFENISYIKFKVNLIKDWFLYLKKFVLFLGIVVLIGAILGYYLAKKTSPIYTAKLSFALEDEKASGGGLAGAMGLASSLGLDLGSGAGGAFSGANLIELIKSRRVIEKALLNPITINNKQMSLANYYIEFNQMNFDWNLDPTLKNMNFSVYADRSVFNFKQDSILGRIYENFAGLESPFNVYQKDKKVGMINIEMKSTDELFAKYFIEAIAKEISEFYIATKSKKARMNVGILQKQVDSIRVELDNAITGVATANDNIFNLNSALNIKKTPSSKRQIDVQANTAILTQLVTNLEIAKLALLKETPLIQVVDKPILPLAKEKVGKLKNMISYACIFFFISIAFLVCKRLYPEIKKLIV